MNQAHVICCNDSVEFVVIGDIHAANAKMAELKQKDEKRLAAMGQSAETYFWHIHVVSYSVA